MNKIHKRLLVTIICFITILSQTINIFAQDTNTKPSEPLNIEQVEEEYRDMYLDANIITKNYMKTVDISIKQDEEINTFKDLLKKYSNYDIFKVYLTVIPMVVIIVAVIVYISKSTFKNRVSFDEIKAINKFNGYENVHQARKDLLLKRLKEHTTSIIIASMSLGLIYIIMTLPKC